MKICGICKRGVREGDPVLAMRVQPQDFSAGGLLALKMDGAPEAGLYHSCPECVSAATPAIVTRVNAALGTSWTAADLPQNLLM